MCGETATLDGIWEFNGLPDEYIVTLFDLAQVENYVTGILEVSNDSTHNLSVEGNNNYPTVHLNFKEGAAVWFSFKGTFTDENTVTGQLSGQFQGAATFTRADQ